MGKTAYASHAGADEEARSARRRFFEYKNALGDSVLHCLFHSRNFSVLRHFLATNQASESDAVSSCCPAGRVFLRLVLREFGGSPSAWQAPNDEGLRPRDCLINLLLTQGSKIAFS